MAQLIPEGFAFVARGDRTRREAATDLLARADKAGIDPTLIRVTNGGYYVPEALVADEDVTDAPVPIATPDEVLEAHEGEDARVESEVSAPAKTASKGDWVDFAKTQGYDESEDLTKSELIERYGG